MSINGEDAKKILKKIELNSFYKLTGTPNLSMFDKKVAESITLEGQKALKALKPKFKK